MDTKRYVLALDLVDDADIIAAYEYYHKPDQIWPEIVAGIKECGITNMDIYRVGNRLVMLMETYADLELDAIYKKMATLPRQKEWATLMDGFQKKIHAAQPDEHWAMMTKIFDLNA